MVFPEPQSIMNYAKVENAISTELSKLSLCFLVKALLDLSKTDKRYCLFSYAETHGRAIVVYLHADKVKFKIGFKTYR